MGHHCLLSGFPTGKYCSDGDVHPDDDDPHDVHPDDDDQDFKMCLQFHSNAFQQEKFGNCW